jgi:hypothetical protein
MFVIDEIVKKERLRCQRRRGSSYRRGSSRRAATMELGPISICVIDQKKDTTADQEEQKDGHTDNYFQLFAPMLMFTNHSCIHSIAVF